MTAHGTYHWVKEGKKHINRSAYFVSTGVKFSITGKVIWRKINKDGSLSNNFAEQFIPDVPWCSGKHFCKVDGGCVLEQFPELKVETERSEQMSDSEYINFLHSTYEA